MRNGLFAVFLSNANNGRRRQIFLANLRGRVLNDFTTFFCFVNAKVRERIVVQLRVKRLSSRMRNCVAGIAVGHVLNDFLVKYCSTKRESVLSQP